MIEFVNLGLYGLGIMGSVLVLNIFDNGFVLNVVNWFKDVIEVFVIEVGDLVVKLIVYDSLVDMVKNMFVLCVIILMVLVGVLVESLIEEFCGIFDKGDIIIDVGNIDFYDMCCWIELVESCGLIFIGMGVLGGEEGVCNGLFIMVGGMLEVWGSIWFMIEVIVVKFNGEFCVDYFGFDGVGYFVKIVYNGIEYVDM